MTTYQLTADGLMIRATIRGAVAWIPVDDGNRDYQDYLRWVAAGNTPDPADHEPEPEPSLDERLLAAVDAAKAAVTDTKVFTARQAAVLSAVFDGLGKAITGEAS